MIILTAPYSYDLLDRKDITIEYYCISVSFLDSCFCSHETLSHQDDCAEQNKIGTDLFHQYVNKERGHTP